MYGEDVHRRSETYRQKYFSFLNEKAQQMMAVLFRPFGHVIFVDVTTSADHISSCIFEKCVKAAACSQRLNRAEKTHDYAKDLE